FATLSPMNTTIFLIRHGDVDLPIIDGKPTIYGPEALLSPQGRQQMSRLGENFAWQNVHFDEIFSSPLLRARQSAFLIAEKTGKPNITYTEGLRGLKYPSWKGKPVEELSSDEQLFTDEPVEEVSNRIWQTFEGIVKANSGRIIGIVLHGEESDMLLRRINKDKSREPLLSNAIPNGEAVRLTLDPEL